MASDSQFNETGDSEQWKEQFPTSLILIGLFCFNPEALEPVKRNVSTTQTRSALSMFSLVILKQKFNVLGKDLVSNEEFNEKMDMRPIRGHSLQTVSLTLWIASLYPVLTTSAYL